MATAAEPEGGAVGAGAAAPLAPARPAKGDDDASLRPRRVLFAALTGVFVTAFPSVILVATLPEIAVDLGTTENVVAWVITAPILFSSVLLPVLGRVGDVVGHRRLFLISLGIAGATSLLAAVAWDVGSLIAFRSISQAAGMATHPAALALLIATYKGAARNRSLGYWAFVAAGSPSIGLAFGGPITGVLGWRGIFVIQAFAALVGVVLARLGLRETPRRKVASFDLAGGLVLMVAVGAVLLGLDRGSDWGWASPPVLACVVALVAASALFVVVERRSKDPMLPLKMLRDRAFAVPIAAESLAQASNMGLFFIIPFILHGQFDQGVAGTAALMLPLPLGMAVFSPIGGRLSWSLGSRRTAVIGATLLVASVGIVALGTAWLSLPVLLVGLTVQGASNGLLRPANSAALSYALADGSLGVGMATMRMIAQVGTALGITVAVAASAPDGSGHALTASAIIGVLALLAATQLGSRRGGVADERGAVVATSVPGLEA
jgi:MFS family permease